MERAIILCKLNKSMLEISSSVGIHRQKSLFTGRFFRSFNSFYLEFEVQKSLSTGSFFVTVFN